MMKIAGLFHLFKWENLHNWWLTKYFFPHCIYLHTRCCFSTDILKELCKLGICEPVLSARLWRMQQTIAMWYVLHHGPATVIQDSQNI